MASASFKASAQSAITPTPLPTPTPTPISPTATETPTPIPTPNPTANPASVMGIQAAADHKLVDISWFRLAYRSCVASGWGGARLQQEVALLHSQGVHVLLTVCQPSAGPKLFDQQLLQEAALGNADAVQCGNEQMKQDALTTYIAPENFAKFYDLCERAMLAVNPGAKVILGSMDPIVAAGNYPLLANQVAYLNNMQAAMNDNVRPGQNWNWRQQTLGLIDSWHNGYPGDYVNNLEGLFLFWAQALGINPDSGRLGKHLWVVEGTGCFKGCGLNQYNLTQVAIAHILSLVTDVKTAKRYQVPFFYFSGRDFVQAGVLWPIGVLNLNGNSKPIRQDLQMGALTLTLTCPSSQAQVADQITLLSKLYGGCTLPANYRSILMS